MTKEAWPLHEHQRGSCSALPRKSSPGRMDRMAHVRCLPDRGRPPAEPPPAEGASPRSAASAAAPSVRGRQYDGSQASRSGPLIYLIAVTGNGSTGLPIYEYRCRKGHTFEVMQSMSDDPFTACTECRRAGRAGLTTRWRSTSRARASTRPTTAAGAAAAAEIRPAATPRRTPRSPPRPRSRRARPAPRARANQTAPEV